MRLLAAALLVLAACGGKPAASTTPRTDPVPPPDGEPAAPGDGDGDDAASLRGPVDEVLCANRPDAFGPVQLDDAQVAQRHGANARTFPDAPSTKERPIEVCGVPASLQWLRGTACADGSPGKQNGRVGNVGMGGRCGSIIDLYTVTCPERAYEVYIDIYMCGPGESMR